MGFKKYSQTQECKNKIIQNQFQNGMLLILNTDEYKQKIKQTNLENWGVEYFTQTTEYEERNKQINLRKVGI
jgi:hypothetical protein